MASERRDRPKLPKSIEEDGRSARVHAALARTRRLWEGGELHTPIVRLSSALGRVIRSAHAAGRVTRGLELTEKKLAGEARGMERADRRSGAERGQRVSRLLLLASDGAERMYRRVETLSRRYPGRLLVLQLECDSGELGALLFGPGRSAKLLMLDHKDAVAEALLALPPAGEGAAGH